VEGGGEVSNGFFKSYYLSIIQDVFVVLTDTLHKSGACGVCVCVCGACTRVCVCVIK